MGIDIRYRKREDGEAVVDFEAPSNTACISCGGEVIVLVNQAYHDMILTAKCVGCHRTFPENYWKMWVMVGHIIEERQ